MSGDLLFALLNPDRLTAIVDIGANPLDGGPAPYKNMLDKGLCSVVGFEPQEAALRTLNDKKSALETYLPYVIGDGNQAKLRLTRAMGLSSTLEPDPVVLKHFAKYEECGRIIGETEVLTTRLDDIHEIQDLDFLKIDIQGGELVVFQNSKEKLKNAVAIQTEVAFTLLYKKQPTFGEIDAELRSQGFIQHAFVQMNKRLIAPLSSDDPCASMNHLLEADAIYVRDFMRPDTMSSDQLIHLAMVAHHAFRSFDLAMNCIFHLVQRKAVEHGATSRYASIIKATR